jgi:hypothetical protein
VKGATLWFFYYGAPATADVSGTGEFDAPVGEWAASGDVVPRVAPAGASWRSMRHSRPILPQKFSQLTIYGVGEYTAPVGTVEGVGGVTVPRRRAAQQEFVLGLRDLEEMKTTRVAA